MNDQPRDRPWTEAEWERFMYESDIRSARYGDLLETFRNGPDCEAIVNSEMGWDHMNEWTGPGTLDSEEIAAADLDLRGNLPLDDDSTAEGLFGDEVHEGEIGLGRSKRKIPGYARAFDWGLRIHHDLQPFIAQLKDPDPDDPWLVASSDSVIVAAKLVGGNAMNRDGGDDTLCANIVCCKRALAAANNAIAALETLRVANWIPRAIADPLLRDGQEVRRLVEERIAELRVRVWWE